MSFNCIDVTPVFNRLKEELSVDLSEALLPTPLSTFGGQLSGVIQLLEYAISDINDSLSNYHILYMTGVTWEVACVKKLVYSLNMKDFEIKILDFDFSMRKIDFERTSMHLLEKGIYLHAADRNVTDKDVSNLIDSLLPNISKDDKDSLMLLILLNN